MLCRRAKTRAEATILRGRSVADPFVLFPTGEDGGSCGGGGGEGSRPRPTYVVCVGVVMGACWATVLVMQPAVRAADNLVSLLSRLTTNPEQQRLPYVDGVHLRTMSR